MNFTASAALQGRTVTALMVRRIRSRYRGSRAGYLWAIAESLVWVFLLKLSFNHGGNAQPPLGTSHEVFFVNGVVLARGFRTAGAQIQATLCRPTRQVLPIVHRLDSAIATWLLEMITGGMVLVASLAILGVFGFDATPAYPLTCIAAFMGTALFALGFGLAMSALMSIAPGLVHFRNVIMLAMFMTSGFTLLLDRIPPQLRNVVSWNPMVHCTEWFREGFYRGYECVSLDRVYLLSVTIGLILVGLAGERAFRRASFKVPVTDWE